MPMSSEEALHREISALKQRIASLEQEQQERKQEQAALAESLRRREAILQAISFTAEQFLKGGDLTANIKAMVQRLGEATGVSRVYTFKNHTADDGSLMMSQRHEWVAPGVAPQIDNSDLQNLSYTELGFTRWVETLSQGAAIHGLIADFPEGERAILEPQDIRSIAVVPVFIGQNWWGFIGFDECISERSWSDIEIRALMAAATMMGSAILRKRSREERDALQQEIIETQQAAIRELSTPLIPLSSEVVLMPLIGALDSNRVQMVMETLLEGIAHHQARTAILDITGVSVVDTRVANALGQISQAVTLLGATIILTGINPHMAQMLVHLGTDLGSIVTRARLQQAIHDTLHR